MLQGHRLPRVQSRCDAARRPTFALPKQRLLLLFEAINKIYLWPWLYRSDRVEEPCVSCSCRAHPANVYGNRAILRADVCCCHLAENEHTRRMSRCTMNTSWHKSNAAFELVSSGVLRTWHQQPDASVCGKEKRRTLLSVATLLRIHVCSGSARIAENAKVQNCFGLSENERYSTAKSVHSMMGVFVADIDNKKEEYRCFSRNEEALSSQWQVVTSLYTIVVHARLITIRESS